MTNTRQVLILTVLAIVMAATRINHFGAIPDASWAVFFVGGFYLRGLTRWAFPALMALAVLVDYIVISGQGLDFWAHYCVSPAYWMLVPAHFALWAGGGLLAARASGNTVRSLGWLLLALPVSVALCHLLAQGSFYWISASVSEPTFAGWWKNYSDWLPSYMAVTAMYVGIATLLHVLATQLAGTRSAPRAAPSAGHA